MNIVNIAAKRRFSLDEVQAVPVASEADVTVELLCFEAGQRTEEISATGTVVYHVIEGEVIIRSQGERDQAGSGKLLTITGGEGHQLENAGGGLLTVMAIRPGPGPE